MSAYNKLRRFRGGGMSLAECQAALETAQQEAAEMRDKYLRAASALDSARKSAERDAEARSADRIRSFCMQLLEVVDNLERALEHAAEDDALRPGVQATLRQMQVTLWKQGVVPVRATPGTPFDPHFHEAIGGHEADVEEETVAELLQNGYVLEGQLLRPARVVVALPRS